MRKFISGLAAGVILGITLSASAAMVVGNTGYLMGWDVVLSNGNTVCTDPYVWPGTREIECD